MKCQSNHLSQVSVSVSVMLSLWVVRGHEAQLAVILSTPERPRGIPWNSSVLGGAAALHGAASLQLFAPVVKKVRTCGEYGSSTLLSPSHPQSHTAA